MSSPVKFDFNSFLQIDRNSFTPIYLQIAQQIINAIQRGIIPVGAKIPGTRNLALHLNLHRKTIVAAFEELESQGWIEVKPNVGSYILQPTNLNKVKANKSSLTLLTNYPEKTGFSFTKSAILDVVNETYSEEILVVNDGKSDIRLSHLHTLTKKYSAALKRKPIAFKVNNSAHQNLYFKNQLTNYLNLTRGLHILPKNILVTRNSEMSLYILAQTILNKNDVVLVGNLSYYKANMIFQQLGAKLKTVTVDAFGMNTDEIEVMAQTTKIRAIYIIPQNHYPTTVTLSAERRIKLLELAKKYGFIIIEDDFDYDFHYEKSAMLPLASADVNGMVVYIGAIGKALLPNFRTGFIVAPTNLINEISKYLYILDAQSEIVMQQVLGEMIEEGEIHRFIKKSNVEYKLRRDFAIGYINQNLKDEIEVTSPNGGLALWLTFKKHINLTQLVSSLKEKNIFLSRLVLYQDKNITAIRFGFGSLSQPEIAEVLHHFKNAIIVINSKT